MNIESIQRQAKNDLKIDESNYDRTANNIPMLHIKYMDMLIESQLKCVQLKSQYDALHKTKYLYYRNDYNVLLKNKAEIDVILNGDEDLQKIKMNLEYNKHIAAYLESIVSQIKGMSFLIRDSIEWKKFQQGY